MFFTYVAASMYYQLPSGTINSLNTYTELHKSSAVVSVTCVDMSMHIVSVCVIDRLTQSRCSKTHLLVRMRST